jgi:hypothetical protein
MKKIILPALFVFCCVQGLAQDPTVKSLKDESGKTIKKEEDTLNRVWRNGGLLSLNLSQGNLTNWAAGGDDFSLSLNSYLNLFSFYKKGKNSWDNTLDVNFGYIKTTTLGSRKNDDRFDVVSKYGHAISKKWNVSALFNFRSQMADGYTYATNTKTFSSAFLSPAYILLSAGMDYKPGPNFSFFISPITTRWVIVKDDTLSAKGLYGVPAGQHSNNEFGAFASANYIKEISKSINYRGRLDLFSNYKRNPQNIDLFMTNVFAVKLAKILSATWNIDFIYDDDTKLFGKNGKSPALQIKSLIGVGLQVKF